MEFISFFKNPLGNLGMMIIPALVLGTGQTGGTMRMTRTMMLEVLRQDYIRTAWSKGLSERIVVLRHAVKNAFIPIVTMIGASVLLAPNHGARAVIFIGLSCSVLTAAPPP